MSLDGSRRRTTTASRLCHPPVSHGLPGYLPVNALYIFDLDGTLARIEHRQHFLEDRTDKQRWLRFFDACDGDAPNLPVIDTMERLRRDGADIWIFSGRNERVRAKTVTWLTRHTSMSADELETALVMREVDDFRSDDVTKQEFLDRMLEEDRQRLIAVFDDREGVVRIWRRNGITCFQVAPGDF